MIQTVQALLILGLAVLDVFSQEVIYVGAGDSIYSIGVRANSVSLLSQKGLLTDIDDMAAGADGYLYVGNGQPSRIVRVDPRSGAQLLLTTEQIGWNLGIETSGDVIAAAGTNIKRLRLGTGKIETVSSGGLLTDIDDIEIGSDGQIYVGNGQPSRIIRVDPKSGVQRLLSVQPIGWNLGIEATGDVIAAAGAKISRLRVATGEIEVVSSGELLTDIDDIKLGSDGTIYVGNGQPSRILRVDPKTGAQVLITTNAIGWNLAVPAHGSPASNARLQILGRLPNASVALRLVSSDSAAWTIEASDATSMWIPIFTNSPVNGFFDFVETKTSIHTIRFYRARRL